MSRMLPPPGNSLIPKTCLLPLIMTTVPPGVQKESRQPWKKWHQLTSQFLPQRMFILGKAQFPVWRLRTQSGAQACLGAARLWGFPS